MFIHCFYDPQYFGSKYFQNAHRICSNFATTEATKGGTSSLKRILKNNSLYREIQRQVKNVMASLCCHGNADVNKTCIITNFHLYVVQMR